uniref:Uncharacterized protein n=1 Tax=Strigamia maritima TaxID=126957 RepID=T1JJW3_STRMM
MQIKGEKDPDEGALWRRVTPSGPPTEPEVYERDVVLRLNLNLAATTNEFLAVTTKTDLNEVRSSMFFWIFDIGAPEAKIT